MNRIKSYIAAIGVIVMVLTFTLLTAAQEGMSVRKVSTSHVHNKQELNTALENLLKKQNAKVDDGRNLVTTTKAGTKLYVTVQRGKVLNYQIIGPTKNGNTGVWTATVNIECDFARDQLWRAAIAFASADTDAGRKEAHEAFDEALGFINEFCK